MGYMKQIGKDISGGIGQDIAGDWMAGQMPSGADASQAYSRDISQIPGMVHPYYDPYVEAGRKALGQYGQQSSELTSDPTGFINHIMSQYYTSPQLQNQMKSMQTAASNAASAGGTLGTGAEQSQVMDRAQQLSANDQQQFLQNAMGAYGQGMQGLSNINQMGYGASGSLANILAQNQRNVGALDYQGRLADDQQQASQIGMEGKTMGDIIGAGASFL